jgi:hypothetical protein
LTSSEQKENITHQCDLENVMTCAPTPRPAASDELEAAIDDAISACGGDSRATIRALLVANEYLEADVGELMKAVSHAYARGRFNAYSG